LCELFHRQDWTAGDVVFVEDFHGLELGLGHGPLLDGVEDELETGETGLRRREIGLGLPLGLADHIANRLPDRSLGNKINVGVGVGLPTFAPDDPARLSAAGVVAGARHGIAEWNSLPILAVFGERTFLDALLVTQLDATEIEHAVLHRREHLLAAAGAIALKE